MPWGTPLVDQSSHCLRASAYRPRSLENVRKLAAEEPTECDPQIAWSLVQFIRAVKSVERYGVVSSASILNAIT